MHVASDKGGPGGVSKKAPEMSVTDNEIKEKYLEKAIRELNQLSRELKSCEACSRSTSSGPAARAEQVAGLLLAQYL